MGGDVQTIKERLDIAEVISGYVKLEKSGTSHKGRCPFHNEKTPSFFVSPLRQSYYCFGCGAKGDIFSFVQEMEGLSFKESLKMLAERAGVEINYRPEAASVRSEKDKIREALEAAAQFFEKELELNVPARDYVLSRGISESSVKHWRLGYAPAEWRALYMHLLERGFAKDILVKAGLVKVVSGGAAKEPYDVFRDRIIFPISDNNGEVIAFSGRALAKETEPKYLNSPDTVLWTKSETLYGLDKAKEKIRRKDYAILVEGQIDLVLSHQVGVDNTVASSGTAFTQAHLERLKRLSNRIILAFDGDTAGEKAAEKSTELGLRLGLEVKIARLPAGQDPAEIVKSDPQAWREILKASKSAIEHFIERTLEEEKDARKRGLAIVKNILPMVALVTSSVERSHFLSLIAKRTGIKEDMLWEDMRRAKLEVRAAASSAPVLVEESAPSPSLSKKEQIEERLTEVRLWLKELPDSSPDLKDLKKEEMELENHLAQDKWREELSSLSVALSQAETSKDQGAIDELTLQVQKVLKEIVSLEERKDLL